MMDESYRPRIITIEGNIGAGKSTLVETMRERYKNRDDIVFLQEPVDIWSTITQDGKTMLELFYANPKKYSFAFQIMAYNTRLKLIQNTINDIVSKNKNVKIIIMERSLDADKNIFAKMLFDDGLMESCMYQIYLQMSDEGMKKYTADGILWIDTPPEICKERTISRNREGEESISIDYLRKCDIYHKEWLSADTGFVYRIENEPNWDEIEKYTHIL